MGKKEGQKSRGTIPLNSQAGRKKFEVMNEFS
jgi:hypothetical protein